MTHSAGLRILMTTDAVGGVWVYASNLARALCESGEEVMLVVTGPPPQAHQLQLLRGIPRLELRTTEVALEWMDPEGADMPRAREQLLRLADEFQPDVVHLNSFREGSFPWPAPLLIVAHSCVQTWWRACRASAPKELRWRVYRDHVAQGLNAAGAWVAPTAEFRHEIQAIYRPAAEGRVIRNGLDIQPIPVTTKQPVILAAGRFWDEAKNLNILRSISAQLIWQLRLAGPTPDENGAAENFCGRLLGDLPHTELMDEMRRASIFVAPALYEPFGLSALEAAACGCALVLSDLPTFHELWGDAALYVDPREPFALQAALQTVCRDKRLRKRLQVMARARARLYSLPAMVRAYRQLYEAMTSTPTAAAMARGRSAVELRA